MLAICEFLQCASKSALGNYAIRTRPQYALPNGVAFGMAAIGRAAGMSFQVALAEGSLPRPGCVHQTTLLEREHRVAMALPCPLGRVGRRVNVRHRHAEKGPCSMADTVPS